MVVVEEEEMLGDTRTTRRFFYGVIVSDLEYFDR